LRFRDNDMHQNKDLKRVFSALLTKNPA